MGSEMCIRDRTFTIRHISGSCPATAAAILRSAAMQLKEMRSAWRMLRWAGLRASRNASVGSAEDLHCNLPSLIVTLSNGKKIEYLVRSCIQGHVYLFIL